MYQPTFGEHLSTTRTLRALALTCAAAALAACGELPSVPAGGSSSEVRATDAATPRDAAAHGDHPAGADVSASVDAPLRADAAARLDGSASNDAGAGVDARAFVDAAPATDVPLAADVPTIIDVPPAVDVHAFIDVPVAADVRAFVDVSAVVDVHLVVDVHPVVDVPAAVDVHAVVDVAMVLDVPAIVDVPAVVDTASVAGAPTPDPVTYTGTFAAGPGQRAATLTVLGDARTVRVVVPSSAAAHPPLIVLFHGTNGDGSVVLADANAVALANSVGAVLAAPDSRWIGHGDFDHVTEETYWETAPNTDPNANEDVVLLRAILVEAQRVYGVDPARIFVMGHSSGGFFAEFVAVLLRDRIAAFAENSSGLVRCAHTWDCGFQGNGTTCAGLRAQPGWCGCAGAGLPIPVPSTGHLPPGFLTHGTADPLVSVQYTCALADALGAAGATVSTQLFNGDGHAVPANWAQLVWPFFATRRLGSN